MYAAAAGAKSSCVTDLEEVKKTRFDEHGFLYHLGFLSALLKPHFIEGFLSNMHGLGPAYPPAKRGGEPVSKSERPSPRLGHRGLEEMGKRPKTRGRKRPGPGARP